MNADHWEHEINIETCLCCGVGEIAGIQEQVSRYEPDDPYHQSRSTEMVLSPELLIEIVKKCVNYQYPHLIFTVAKFGDYRIGDRIMRFIRKYHLGTVRASEFKKNPNSQNMVKAYMWEVDWEKMNSFEGVPQPKKATGPKGAANRAKRTKA